MIDVHCHLLPGIDDGAPDLSVSLAMARVAVADGIHTTVCTPHITPGVYRNSGSQIRDAVAALQQTLDDQGIALRLENGADNHLIPGFVAGLRSGQLLSIAGSRYVLVELPQHVPVPRMEEAFFDLMVAGYVPILTHPERLSWMDSHGQFVESIARSGVWLQITAGSLEGNFGRRAKYWAERLIAEGYAQLLASDAHDPSRRRPVLSKARELAERLVGGTDAASLVLDRPAKVLENAESSSIAMPIRSARGSGVEANAEGRIAGAGNPTASNPTRSQGRRRADRDRGRASWLQRFFT
jgi:protein-tyrosine phosphatase